MVEYRDIYAFLLKAKNAEQCGVSREEHRPLSLCLKAGLIESQRESLHFSLEFLERSLKGR